MFIFRLSNLDSIARLLVVGLTATLLTLLPLNDFDSAAAVETDTTQNQSLAAADSDFSTQIVGGSSVSISYAPWQVALINTSATNHFQGRFCGGSLLSNEWILTAAHCLVGSSGEIKSTASFGILAGQAILSSVSNASLAVSEIIIHPSYSPPLKSHDIALVRLGTPITLVSGSKEAISVLRTSVVHDQRAEVTGWGQVGFTDPYGAVTSTQPTGFPYELQGAEVFIRSNEYCESYYPGSYLSEMMVCADAPDENWKFGVDTCQGDSGGPLAVDLGRGYRLAGITSFGEGCAWEKPGVYTKVSNYASWVDFHTSMQVDSRDAQMVLKVVPNKGDGLVKLPFSIAGSTDSLQLSIDWGDGTVDLNSTDFFHSYSQSATARTITVSPTGSLIATHYGSASNFAQSNKHIVEVIQFPAGVKSYSFAFLSASNLIAVPSQIPTGVIDMESMFNGAAGFRSDISGWDTISVMEMYAMFYGATSFSSDISGWDTSKVTDMSFMFDGATSFDSDISGWDTISVMEMYSMFGGATSFSSDISGWDTSNVTDMSSMFWSATSFDSDISGWDTSNVTDMSSMFWSATSFSSDISGWDTRNVRNMMAMFLGATSFNSDLSRWGTSNVTDMSYMFFGATAFNQCLPIGFLSGTFTDMFIGSKGKAAFCEQMVLVVDPRKGDGLVKLPFSAPNTTSALALSIDWGDGTIDLNSTSFSHQYSSSSGIRTITVSPTGSVEAERFGADDPATAESNKQIIEVVQFPSRVFDYVFAFSSASNLITVSGQLPPDWVVRTSWMFYGATSFSSDISGWDTSSVRDMYAMFYGATSFNSDLSRWDTSQVTDMSFMFDGATSFDSDLSLWDTGKVTNMKYMFREATSFDSNLRIWNTSKVTNMEDMFNGATAFNQPIGGWITSEVRNMSSMFNGATAFNQTIGDWETSKVEDMSYMFRKATSFNSDIGGWDTRNVAKMSYMFLEATSFDSDLSRWNTGKVTNMEYMFLGATSFARCLPATFIMGTFVGIFSDSSGSASSTCGSSTPANPAGGGGGGGGLILPPASASASASATAVSVISIDRGLVQAGSLITLFGTKLDLVAGASIDGVGLVIRSQSPTSLTLLLPGVISDGVKDIVLSSIQGFYTARAILKISAQAVDAPAALERKVNAGSFKGFVAIYARGYEGARLSAKVGKDWVIINRIPKRSGDLFRVVEFTGAGVNVQVRVFIDRVLLATIPLKTK